MIIRASVWVKVRDSFTEQEKADLRAAKTGDTICPRGAVLDLNMLSPDLKEKLFESHQVLTEMTNKSVALFLSGDMLPNTVELYQACGEIMSERGYLVITEGDEIPIGHVYRELCGIEQACVITSKTDPADAAIQRAMLQQKLGADWPEVHDLHLLHHYRVVTD